MVTRQYFCSKLHFLSITQPYKGLLYIIQPYNTDNMYNIIVYELSRRFSIQLVLHTTPVAVLFLFLLFVSNILCISLFVVLVSVLTHSRDFFWCCDCCCSTGASDGRPPHSTTPLLSGREVERQYTRSLEGSHSGSTTSYNPLEMSDCRPDYRP